MILKRTACLAATIILTTTATPLLAQDAGTRGAQHEVQPFPINFDGGSLADYYQMVQDFGVNAVYPAEASLIPMPPFRVDSYNMDGAAKLPQYMIAGVSITHLNRSLYAVRIDPNVIAAYSQGRPATTFDLNFPGGTIQQYINAVQENHPTANIVLLPGAESIMLPPANLHDVTVRAAVELLDGQIVDGNSDPAKIDVSDVFVAEGKDELYRISAQQSSHSQRTAIWSIAHLLDAEHAVSIDSVISAIQTALELEDAETPRMSFHEDTRLLMVRGTNNQLEVVESVLEAIEQSLVTSNSNR